MSAIGVDVGYVTRLASNSGFRWMKSLQPLRQEVERRTSGCCGGRQGIRVSARAINQLAADPRFVSELQELKHRLGADRLIVAVGRLRTTL